MNERENELTKERMNERRKKRGKSFECGKGKEKGKKQRASFNPRDRHLIEPTR